MQQTQSLTSTGEKTEELAKNGEKPTTLKGWINSEEMKRQFSNALPRHLSSERFCRIAITALSRTPKLMQCEQASVMKCLLDLSAMGLEPDGRHAHLIPYGKVCTLIVDYKGLVSLVRRSGEVAKIHCDIVCENDDFEHSMGEVVKHTYDLKKERGEPYAAYAQVTLKDGSTQAEIMSRPEIEAIRDKSDGWKAFKSGKIKESPWNPEDKGSVGEMWKKTAFRRLTKWLTLSPEVMENIYKADEHEFSSLRNVTPQRGEVTVTEPIVPEFNQSAPEDDQAEVVYDPETPAQEKSEEDVRDAKAAKTPTQKEDLW